MILTQSVETLLVKMMNERREEIEAARREIPLDFADRNGVWVEITAMEARQEDIDRAREGVE